MKRLRARLALAAAAATIYALAFAIFVLDRLPVEALDRPVSPRAKLTVAALGASVVFVLVWLCIEWIGLLA